MTSLDRRGSVFVLTLGDDENRFHPDRLTAINAALDEVDAARRPEGGGHHWRREVLLERP